MQRAIEELAKLKEPQTELLPGTTGSSHPLLPTDLPVHGNRAFDDVLLDNCKLPSQLGLTITQGVFLSCVVLMLNSILAGLGSILWAHIPYWPGFMIIALICAYYPRWGIGVAILSPIFATILLTGGPAVYLYLVVNLIQALLIVGAFRTLRIDPHLPSTKDALMYVAFAAILPSAFGALCAWALYRVATGQPPDASVATYTFWWSAENVLPCIFPGIWLHRTVGELYKPFSWDTRHQGKSWLQRTLQYSLPWIATLFIAGVSSDFPRCGASRRARK